MKMVIYLGKNDKTWVDIMVYNQWYWFLVGDFASWDDYPQRLAFFGGGWNHEATNHFKNPMVWEVPTSENHQDIPILWYIN